MNRLKTQARGDRGAAAVEFALVVPMLLLIVFGLIDFGRMLNAQITITESAREGARANALGLPVQPRVDLASAQLGDVTGTVVSGHNCANGDDDAEVKTAYTFKFVTPVGVIAGLISGNSFGGDVTLTGVGVMPCRG